MQLNILLAEKQIEFIAHSTAKINLAHGSVRSGKTVGTLFRFMQAVCKCPDSQIWMIGHTSSTIFDNAIRLLLEPAAEGMPDPLAIFRPFCTWFKGAHELHFKDKIISTVGVNNSGAMGAIQGKTFSLCYCDEMTLYPDSIIDMISTRLSLPHSLLIATMNPMQPTHKLKGWIDAANAGDPNYYNLHFTLEDNPFVEDHYKKRIRDSLSGVFYKRNYLGLWCLAEGAIFDFFDRAQHVIKKPRHCAEYFVVGIDYGTSNAFAAVLLGVNTGRQDQTGYKMWVEKEYYWDSKKTQRQKVSSEYAEDMKKWLDPYPVKTIYIDPSAENFRIELQRMGMHIVPAKNDVMEGIVKLTSEIKKGNVLICEECKNLIREIEGYVWDPKATERGEDEPLKRDDHAVDALRYVVASHRPATFDADDYYRRKEMALRQENPFGYRSFR